MSNQLRLDINDNTHTLKILLVGDKNNNNRGTCGIGNNRGTYNFGRGKSSRGESSQHDVGLFRQTGMITKESWFLTHFITHLVLSLIRN